MIEIIGVGGYTEIGRNMTAIKIDDKVIICDLGIHVENWIKYTEDEDLIRIDKDDLISQNVVPDISCIDHWKNKVCAIIPTHAHLDHIGAIPFFADEYQAPIICTPFTKAVLDAIVKDEKIRLKNKVISLNVNSTYKISDDITLEFINMTHSTPHTVMIALHTKYGVVIYANDFKFDRTPTLGQPPNFKRLKELGDIGVIAAFIDSTYAYDERKMPSEAVAKQMLKDVLLGTDATGKAILITTFSSHLARLKSIIDIGAKLDRDIIILGRSLAKYIKAGEEVGIIDFTDKAKYIGYRKQIDRTLENLQKKGRDKSIIIITGHQGEPKAILSRIASGETGFRLEKEDHIIFSCTTIPAETNIIHRKALEEKLKKQKVRIFKDIHVSGHGAREDIRDLLNLIRPKHIIPAHGTRAMTEALKDLAESMGYGFIHVLDDKEYLTVD